ncbi:MAG: rhodanese-like domain-containing protein [Candidatus Poribacteria bacterium]|nr:rhodanese-like domain-containing protein [Candidatus Poribacteria bacterium]
MKTPVSHTRSPQSTATLPSSAKATETPPPFQPEKHEISVRELKQKLDQGEPLLLLDVREPFEHQIAHLADAVLIPMNHLPQQAGQLEPNDEIVIYCHHGMRSMHAAYYLYQIGFQNVKSLSGGIDQWAIEIEPTLNRY